MALASAERSKFKRQAIGEAEGLLGGLGWLVAPWRGTGRLFTLAESVTPYLLISNIAGRRFGQYAIEGSFGVIHRPFEQSWSSAAQEDADTDQFTLALHTANFHQLDESRYVDARQELRPQVARFCEAALAVFRSFPVSEAGLVTAYRVMQ